MRSKNRTAFPAIPGQLFFRRHSSLQRTVIFHRRGRSGCWGLSDLTRGTVSAGGPSTEPRPGWEAGASSPCLHSWATCPAEALGLVWFGVRWVYFGLPFLFLILTPGFLESTLFPGPGLWDSTPEQARRCTESVRGKKVAGSGMAAEMNLD